MLHLEKILSPVDLSAPQWSPLSFARGRSAGNNPRDIRGAELLLNELLPLHFTAQRAKFLGIVCQSIRYQAVETARRV